MKPAEIKNLAHTYSDMTDGKTPSDAGSVISDFALYLKKKRLLGKGDAIIESYRRISNAEQGIIEADVTSHSPLSDTARAALKEKLKQKYHANAVDLIEKVDQRLLGGMKVRVADELFDGSVQTALKKLEASLLQ